MYENVDCGWLLWCTFNFFDFHQSIYVQVWDNWDNCHIHPYSTILNLAPSSDLGFQFHVFLLVFLQCSHHTFLKRALWPPARPASASVKLLWFTKLNRWGLGLIFQLSSHGKDQHLWRRENVSAHSNFKRSKEKTRQLALALWFSLDIWTGPKLMTSMTRQRMRHVTWQAPMVKASSRFRGEICLWKLGESNSTFHLPSIFKVVPPWWAWEPPTRASLWTLYVTMWMFFMLLLLLFLLRPLRNAKKCNTIDIVFRNGLQHLKLPRACGNLPSVRFPTPQRWLLPSFAVFNEDFCEDRHDWSAFNCRASPKPQIFISEA